MDLHPRHAELQSIAEAAARLHVSTKTVRRYIAAGRLEAYRLGGRLIRVDAGQVDRLLRPIPALPYSPRQVVKYLHLTPNEHRLRHANSRHRGRVVEIPPS